jgi:hypothetical protein
MPVLPLYAVLQHLQLRQSTLHHPLQIIPHLNAYKFLLQYRNTINHFLIPLRNLIRSIQGSQSKEIFSCSQLRDFTRDPKPRLK